MSRLPTGCQGTGIPFRKKILGCLSEIPKKTIPYVKGEELDDASRKYSN